MKQEDIFSTETFTCRKHDLKFQYPGNWSPKNLTPPACPLCKQEAWDDLSKKYVKIREQNSKLLEVIEIKLNSKTESL